MKKKKWKLLVSALGIVLICGIGILAFLGIKQKEKNVLLKWGIMNAGSDISIFEEAVNAGLKEKGFPYQIEFVDITVDISKGYGDYLNDYMDSLVDAKVDIINCSGIYGTYDLYAMMIQRDMLEPMNDFIDGTDIGKQLYNSYPSKIWESVKDNGKVYGILTPYTNLDFYAVMNQRYYSEYQEPVDQMSVDDFKSLMIEAKKMETEKGNFDFMAGTYLPSSRFSENYEYTVCNLIEVNVKNGKTAVNLLEDQEYLEWLKETYELYRTDVLGDDFTYLDKLQKGNFLSASMYSYSPEAAEKTFRVWYEIPDEIELKAVEVPELSNVLNGSGVKNCVYSGSAHKKEAMEALASIYSEAELSNALVYGKENISYIKNGGIAQYATDYSTSGSYMQERFGNPFLTYPGVTDDENKGKVFWETVENAQLSDLAGFHFDVDKIAEKSEKLNALLNGSSFLNGKTEDLENDLSNLKEAANIEGISLLVDEMNRQLEQSEEVVMASDVLSEWFLNMCFTSDGILFKNPNTNWMEYYDYNVNSYQLLCARPNCAHDTDKCEAIYLAQKAYFIGKVEDQWIYYSEDDELNGSFYSCNIDGTNEKKMGSFSHLGGSTVNSRVIFFDSACLFATGEDKFDEETGQWIGTVSGIYLYDFITHKESLLCEEKEYMRPAYCIYGVLKNQLIYTEWDGEGNILKVLDLGNGQSETLIKNEYVMDVALTEPYIVCSTQKGENYKLKWIQIGDKEWTEMEIQDAAGEIFWSEDLKTYTVYDYDKMSTYVYMIHEEDHTAELIRKTDGDFDFTPCILIDGILIGQIENEMAMIPLEAYLSGSDEWSVMRI